MPRNKKNTDIKPVKFNLVLDYFLNLFLLISLGWITWSVITIYFQIINKYLENVADIFAVSYTDIPIRYGIASLIVIVPIYFFVSSLFRFKYKKGELNSNSGITRWSLYLILSATLFIMAGSLITLINNFLNGLTSISAILKILTVLIISGLIFSYYYYRLKNKFFYQTVKWVEIIFIVLAVLIVLGGIVGGFLSIEKPQTAKDRLLDQKISEVMSNLSGAIVYFYKTNGFVGNNLDVKQLVPVNLSGIVEDNISYRKISENEFELCAIFKTDSFVSKEFFSAGDIDYPWIFYKKGQQCYVINAETIAEKYYNETELPVESLNFSR
jgi:uncharacterized membrane protein